MAEVGKSGNFRPLRSVMRLLIGGILLGSEALKHQLRDWDDNADETAPANIEGDDQTALQFEPLPETLPAPQVGLPVQRNDSDVRYALIGLVFESEEKFERALTNAKRIGDSIDRALNPLFRPIQKLGAIRPVRNSFGYLASRGQSEVDRWISRGREEEDHSRQLAQQATTSTVDQSITYMAHNPALEELIQHQSVSLAMQILDQIRENAVSADYFFEGLIRYMLRRPPRYLLPPPSPEVQEQATWTFRDLRYEDL